MLGLLQRLMLILGSSFGAGKTLKLKHYRSFPQATNENRGTLLPPRMHVVYRGIMAFKS